MKIVIAGDRYWDDDKLRKRIRLLLLKLIKECQDLVVITGGCRGVDTAAYETALDLGIETLVFKPDWGKYGRSAGPIRNRLMLDEEPSYLHIYHSDINNSKGSKDIMKQAQTRGISVIIHE